MHSTSPPILGGMRRVAHISDLHFGEHDERAAAALLASLERDRPSVVAVSGDLTRRARRREFERARAFFDEVPFPLVVVPGNHDVPLYNVVARFAWPLARFRRFIAADLTPLFVDAEVAVLGINTARSCTIQSGRISHEQIEFIGRRFHELGHDRFKVLVSHHPFLPHPDRGDLPLVGRGALALATLERVGVQVLLTGHLHLGFTGDVTAHYPAIRRSMLVVQAGTALSKRLRGQPNAYNLLTIELPRLRCEARVYDGEDFADIEITEYELREGRWELRQAEA